MFAFTCHVFGGQMNMSRHVVLCPIKLCPDVDHLVEHRNRVPRIQVLNLKFLPNDEDQALGLIQFSLTAYSWKKVDRVVLKEASSYTIEPRNAG